MMTNKAMTLAERYPNVKPRLMTPQILAAEGKGITQIGPAYLNDYRAIITTDGRGVNEAHFIARIDLPSQK